MPVVFTEGGSVVKTPVNAAEDGGRIRRTPEAGSKNSTLFVTDIFPSSHPKIGNEFRTGLVRR